MKSLYTSIPILEGIKTVKLSHENFTKEIISKKAKTTFLALILSYSTQSTFYKSKVLQWELSPHHPTQICSWTILSENTYVHL